MNHQTVTRKTIARLLSMFNECYPGKMKTSDTTEKIWLKMLEDLDAGAVLAACYHLCSTKKDWPPDIATIRETVAHLSHGELTQLTGYDAWENVMRKLQDDDVQLTALESKAVSQVSTIYDLRRSTSPAADRANFIRAFELLVKKRHINRVTLPEVKALVNRNMPAFPEANKTEQLPEPDDEDLVPAEDIRRFADTFEKLVDMRE